MVDGGTGVGVGVGARDRAGGDVVRRSWRHHAAVPHGGAV
jgi:hypothetical protein